MVMMLKGISGRKLLDSELKGRLWKDTVELIIYVETVGSVSEEAAGNTWKSKRQGGEQWRTLGLQEKCKEENVSRIIVGDVTNIAKTTQWAERTTRNFTSGPSSV